MQVFGLEWNPYEATHEGVPSCFATYGKKHAKIWTGANGQYTSLALTFEKLTLQNFLSAQWLPPRAGSSECLLAFGMADGHIYLYKCVTAFCFHS